MESLSAVQQAMLVAAQKNDPNVTEADIQALSPKQVSQWMQQRMQSGGENNPDPIVYTPDVPGLAKGLNLLTAPSRGVGEGGRGVVHAIRHPLDTAAGLQSMFFNGLTTPVAGSDVSGQSVGARGGVPIRPAGGVVPQDAPGAIAPETANLAGRQLATMPLYSLGPLGAAAAGAASSPSLDPEDIAQSAGQGVGMYGAGEVAGYPVAKAVGAVKSLHPSVRGPARVAKAIESSAGGREAVQGTMNDAAMLGKSATTPLAAASPELGAEFRHQLANADPRVRAEMEATQQGHDAGAVERSQADMAMSNGPTTNATSRAEQLAKQSGDWADEQLATLRRRNPSLPASDKLTSYFQQPMVSQAVADAERVGLIGDPLDPAAVAQRDFAQKVAEAQDAQVQWDEWAKMFKADAPRIAARSETVPTSDVSAAERALGPRPEVPTEPPGLSFEQAHHIVKRLRTAIDDGFKAGGAKADVAARLKPIKDYLNKYLEDNASGYGEFRQGFRARKELEGAIRPTGKPSMAHQPTLSAEEIWNEPSSARVKELEGRVSVTPVEGVGVSPRDELANAIRSHLNDALASKELTAEKLTPEALRGNPALRAKLEIAFPRRADLNSFTARAKIASLRPQNLKIPSAQAVGEAMPATAPWWYKVLPLKMAYQATLGKYRGAVAKAELPLLSGSKTPPKPKPINTSSTANATAALTAMLAARQGKPNAP